MGNGIIGLECTILVEPDEAGIPQQNVQMNHILNISLTVVAQNDLTPEQAVKVASLVDDYMDYQQEYLESKGLVEWD